MNKNVLLIYPHQLYPAEQLPKDVDRVFVIEDPLMFGRDPQYPLYLHKQKLVLHRASMRRYVEEVLWPAGYQVEYIEFHHMNETGDIVNKLVNAEQVEYFDPTDDVLGRRLVEALEGLESKPVVRQIESPNFYLTREEVKSFFAKKDKANFNNFYQWQRERFNILINQETYKPLGGKLSFDSESRKRLPKEHSLPTFQVFGSNKFVDEAKQYISKHFPDNPGNLEDFPWPTNHDEAYSWLEEFVENRLDDFGPYQDAMDGDAPWVYHSALSPVMNIGLLSPTEVVDRAIRRNSEREVPIASLEAFVRQVIGWREYTRGLYVDRHVALRTANTFDHQRHLTNEWYLGNTGIQPLDDVIKKILTRGYAHNIERLMIVGNVMFMCEINPQEIYRWFMEMFVDSYDWTIVPNVYSIGEGGAGVKPNVSSSNYILSMSHYDKDLWCDVWDGLYWGFVEKNRDVFAKNQHTRLMVQQLDKLQDNRKRIISYRAEDFLREKTVFYL